MGAYGKLTTVGVATRTAATLTPVARATNGPRRETAVHRGTRMPPASPLGLSA